jgi:hypothetical protein
LLCFSKLQNSNKIDKVKFSNEHHARHFTFQDHQSQGKFNPPYDRFSGGGKHFASHTCRIAGAAISGFCPSAKGFYQLAT